MTNSCDLTGHAWLNGSNISHSHRVTKRRFMPNLQKLTLSSDVLGEKFRFRVTTKTLRTIDFKGGLDMFLLMTKNAKLTKTALSLKKRIIKKSPSQQNAAGGSEA